ncbi:hypothetical protein [Delftia phage IME-DE1]|uniref:Uncharacterized protein n=1 Tax=Delftia phage IME-DE1 TaxID=1647385 RepID=A0A0F7IKQ7_9CAUD|nr:hypothetical protein AU155_gp28 [Delftia phage IME-DE1]AKG94491.1 hypothetical protein [Delftia phage IME-DE1]
MNTIVYPEFKKYRAFGHAHGYPYGLTVTVEAEDIEAAHEEAEQRLDEVVSVSGPL